MTRRLVDDIVHEASFWATVQAMFVAAGLRDSDLAAAQSEIAQNAVDVLSADAVVLYPFDGQGFKQQISAESGATEKGKGKGAAK